MSESTKIPVRSQRLTRAEWQAEADAYRQRVQPMCDDRVQRMANGRKHPVFDFLFEYYSYRPAHLMRWSPGIGVVLEDARREELDWTELWKSAENGLELSPEQFPPHRVEYVKWAVNYLRAVRDREPNYHCFGMHEWAMVYRAKEVRHVRVPLRVSESELEAIVEAKPLKCTHYDAYRFFTPAAVPRNRIALTRQTTTDHDQPGCIHANMDLYKFSFKIAPYCASDVVAAAFALAKDAREIDMRASPYDLRELGYEPIRIESREGCEEYVGMQRMLAFRSRAIRDAVLGEYVKLIETA